MKRLFALALIFTMCLSFTGCVIVPESSGTDTHQSTLTGENTDVTAAPPVTDGDVDSLFPSDAHLLKISYLDVGQGDSVFIAFPDGVTVLIDASESKAADTIINYIKESGFNKIDYIIATHPHADHIGGMTDVINAFSVGTIYMPNATATTKTFENMLDAIEAKSIPIKRAKAGVTIAENRDYSIKILAPVDEDYEDLNDSSAVVKIEYKERSFLFMGDAGINSENKITADISCDVIKVGHHGSRTSSSSSFVNKTGAKYAVFSVGEGNSYGHPHTEALENWQSLGAMILRTDILGNIVAVTDGKELHIVTGGEVLPENGSTPTPDQTTPEYNWILNTNTCKIHKEGCSSLKNMSESNKAVSNKSIKELESEGYTTCKICKPTD